MAFLLVNNPPAMTLHTAVATAPASGTVETWSVTIAAPTSSQVALPALPSGAYLPCYLPSGEIVYITGGTLAAGVQSLTVMRAMEGSPVTTYAGSDVVAIKPGVTASSLSPVLPTAEAKMASDLTLVAANTYYDGPSVSLSPGTWIVLARSIAFSSTGNAFVAVKLWDGATVYDSSNVRLGAGLESVVALLAVVTPTVTTTYKLSAASNVGASASSLLSTIDGLTHEGANATHILALKAA